MKKILWVVFLFSFVSGVFAKAVIDQDILEKLKNKKYLKLKTPSTLSLIIFLHSYVDKKAFLKELKDLPEVKLQQLDFMPAVAVTIPAEKKLLFKIANYQEPAQISTIKGGTSELEISTQVLKLTPSLLYPDIKNWWDHGFTGSKGIVGIIDDGVDPNHPALASKRLIALDKNSRYPDFLNGVRTSHGTGVACIYASGDSLHKGIAYGTSTILSGLSGEETPNLEDIMMTLSTLDWMLERAEIKPTLINYSMGNGHIACPFCPEWSGLAKVIDYVVNHHKILWVKSAGNEGYIAPTPAPPFATTLTVPGDNYNALTIANMDTLVSEGGGVKYKTTDRDHHSIRVSSSRGPTPSGRRKPDLTAPGHLTRTCAPDPQVYNLKYSAAMDYHDGYRLMGGTSAAAPHVGASALLLQDAGIKNPMAIKALLINSADAWTDSGEPVAVNKNSEAKHFQVMGSEWNRTYGWGYINMEKAFVQRHDLIESQLTLENPVREFHTLLDVGDKVTLVHERRVGYFDDSTEWKLSHLSLELINMDTHKLISRDDSPIDTVHQVANCNRVTGQKTCSAENKPIHALVRIRLLSPKIDGSSVEPFALVLKMQKEVENETGTE